MLAVVHQHHFCQSSCQMYRGGSMYIRWLDVGGDVTGALSQNNLPQLRNIFDRVTTLSLSPKVMQVIPLQPSPKGIWMRGVLRNCSGNLSKRLLGYE